MDVCEICDYKFTRVLRKRITCTFCQKTCCLTCFKNYIGVNDDSDFKCMFSECRHELTFSYVSNIVPKYVYKDMVAKLSKKLFEEEKLNLKAELPRYTNDSLRMCYERMVKFFNGKTSLFLSLLECKIEKVCKQKISIEDFLAKKRNDTYERLELLLQNQKKKVKKRFICLCPVNGCVGIVYKESCNACGEKVCEKCHELKGTNHVCDPVILQNIKAITSSDTKPCPKCFVPVFKISGCNQMFCSMCKTAFSWTTLKIEKPDAPIHNPHYFEWRRMQQQAGENNDLFVVVQNLAVRIEACGRFDEVEFYSSLSQNEEFRKEKLFKLPIITENIIPRFMQILNHMIQALLNDLNRDDQMVLDEMRDNHIQQLSNLFNKQLNLENKTLFSLCGKTRKSLLARTDEEIDEIFQLISNPKIFKDHNAKEKCWFKEIQRFIRCKQFMTDYIKTVQVLQTKLTNALLEGITEKKYKQALEEFCENIKIYLPQLETLERKHGPIKNAFRYHSELLDFVEENNLRKDIVFPV